MVNKIYLYLKGDEELGEIIQKIREKREKEIVLVVPQNTRALLHPVNLDIFKTEIEKLDKKVYLDTDDEKLINLARHYKILLFLMDFEEKQIVDIKPPKSKTLKRVSPETSTKPRINFFVIFKRFAQYLIILIFMLGISYVLWTIFQARAEIYIETEKIPFELTKAITLKENVVNPDYDNKILPADYKKVEIFRTETVTTTGKLFDEEKPLLKVVFLNYLNNDIPLAIGTRLAFGENIFKTTERIIIPAGKDNEPGQIVTTAIPATLKDENLKISEGEDLSIVALVGRKTRDGKLWSDVLRAKAASDYNLAETVKIGTVLPSDITKVKMALEESLRAGVKTELSFRYPQAFYYFDPSLVKVEILNISHNVGEKTNKISATGKAVFETMIISQKEFDNFVRNLIGQEILNNKKNLLIKSFEYDKIELLDFDPKKRAMTLGVSVKALLIPDINIEALKQQFKAQALIDVQNYFSRLEGVKKVRIKIFPQWKNNFPNDLKRIKIFME